MAAVKFYLRDPKAKESTTICLSFNYDGRRLQCSTKLKISPKDWSKRSNYPKHQITSYSQYNDGLSRIKTIIEEFYLDCKMRGIVPSCQEIKDHLESQQIKPVENIVTIWSVYEKFLLFKAQEVKELTLKKYKTLQKILKNFDKDRAYELGFNNCNAHFELAFKSYLNQDLDQVNDTASKYIECIKVFLRWAEEEGFHENKAYEKFKSKRSVTEIEYLTRQELALIRKLDLESNPRLAKIRDRFFFQCFTGQRVSDIQNLKWKDIVDNKTWHLYQVKGNKTKKIVIPLIGFALEVLERQKKGLSEDLVFPIISDQKYNEYIKELCKLAEIKSASNKTKYKGKRRVEISKFKHEVISSHTARRTFVTLALELGMKPETIMAITGHEDYKTMKKYIKIVEDRKAEEMNKAFGEDFFKV